MCQRNERSANVRPAVVACNQCHREYVRRAHRCVKHTAACYGKSPYELKDLVKYEPSLFEVAGVTELQDATQSISEGQLLQATGQTMEDGTVLVSVVEGQGGQVSIDDASMCSHRPAARSFVCRDLTESCPLTYSGYISLHFSRLSC